MIGVIGGFEGTRLTDVQECDNKHESGGTKKHSSWTYRRTQRKFFRGHFSEKKKERVHIIWQFVLYLVVSKFGSRAIIFQKVFLGVHRTSVSCSLILPPRNWI